MLQERLPKRKLSAFFDSENAKPYPKGEIFYRENENHKEPVLYGVQDGLVGIQRRDAYSGRNFILHVARPGDVFGAEDYVQGFYGSTAKALVPSTVAIQEIRDEDHMIPFLYDTIADRIRDLGEKQDLLKNSRRTFERTAFALAELSLDGVVKVSQQTIAETAGRERVLQELDRLQKKGEIRRGTGYKNIYILDREKVLKEAEIAPADDSLVVPFFDVTSVVKECREGESNPHAR